jgi:hypothetical protein
MAHIAVFFRLTLNKFVNPNTECGFKLSLITPLYSFAVKLHSAGNKTATGFDVLASWAWKSSGAVSQGFNTSEEDVSDEGDSRV